MDDKDPQSDNVKIYVFDASEWLNTFPDQNMDLRVIDNEFISLIRPAAKNNMRLIAQRGIYTITNVSDMESFIIGKQSEKTFLYSAEISVKERPKIMKDLNLMGINEMTMFPGLDGTCRALKEQFFSRYIVGETPSEKMKRYLDIFDQNNVTNNEHQIKGIGDDKDGSDT